MEGFGRSLSRAASRATSWRGTGAEDVFSRSGSSMSQRHRIDEDEEALRWAAIERLPTYDRVRTSLVQNYLQSQTSQRARPSGLREVDVRQLGLVERQAIIESIIQVAEIDNEKLLSKFRRRIDRVGIRLPTVEVRYEHLTVDADCYVGSRALPTLTNSAVNYLEGFLSMLGLPITKKVKRPILKDATGILKPARIALLLGPPGSGKTTLLLALAGRLNPKLKMKGEITYNGHKLDEFVPQKTSAYISQHDLHVGEMTVRETIDFAARCQGVGDRYDLLTELARREKVAGIFPDAEVDLFMKATATEGTNSNLQTDYTLKILGLDICAGTIVGDHMQRGVSGGQKKRVTTGEMIVGPTKTLFMDEISTGLDTSTTFQIVKCLQQFAHYMDATILMSLLQPAPETFELFDDIVFLSEGQIVYHGPRENVLEFFESCGFKCPERKGVADFLQEVTSKKDQEQYWANSGQPYRYVSVKEFAMRFKNFSAGQHLESDLSIAYDKRRSHPVALVFNRNPVPRMEIFKACFAKEWLLVKRNSFVYIVRTVQIIIVAFITATVFLRTRMHHRDLNDANSYLGCLFFSLIINMFNGFAELAMTISRLPVFFKQRDLLFYPAWAFTLPTFILRIPTSLIESGVWVLVTYYTTGFAPEASRFFRQFLLIFLIHQMASSLFRLIAGVFRSMVVASTAGCFILLVIFFLNGYTIPKDLIPRWWKWGYWISPLGYGESAIAVNEMLAPRWKNVNGSNLGVTALKQHDLPHHGYWYWIGIGALAGFSLLFNLFFTWALTYLSAPGEAQHVVSEEALEEDEPPQMVQQIEMGMHYSGSRRQRPSLASADSNYYTLEELMRVGSRPFDVYGSRVGSNVKAGTAIPFQPLVMSFDDVQYFVDMPPEMKVGGVTEDRLQLLRGVTGAFRPGILTALMGVSGAGKTTLMDVLAGRKTAGYIEGDTRISGYKKKQETFARISGYCEQTDIHSPQLTVIESLLYSAFLRLPKEVGENDKLAFVNEVMELVELDSLKDALVGLPGVTGLSTEQRKRLTIAVELVANPSIIFMDEPTSGLDARAAAIVMRTVRNTVNTGRTVVCTIHQPSIEIFESFDELLLMKRGGQVIYFGPLGEHSRKIIEYFEAIPGVPKIKEKYNPATWMLEASSVAVEQRLGIDFAEHYKKSSLFKRNIDMVKEFSIPPPGSKDLYFETQYSQTFLGQFKYCLWKQRLTYWRSPDYNSIRLFCTFVCALILGSIFWDIGSKRDTSDNLITVAGALYGAVIFLGINNCSTVQPVISVERTVFYRERGAGMYSALPYAMSQVVIELPYIFVETIIYCVIVYTMMGFQMTASKILWFFFLSYVTFLYFTYYGMMTVAITPNHHVAAIFAAAFYGLFNLFSGFFVPKPRIPGWWIWYYYICPVGWTVYGLVASQYGDVTDRIDVAGEGSKPINQFVDDYFGYKHSALPIVAVVLLVFTIFFSCMYAYCIKVLNFQQR